MTRQEKLIQLVAGLGSWMTTEGKITHASELLAEIDKVCPEDEAPFASVPVLPMDVQVAISDAVARTRIEERVAERERCAKIADGYADDPRDPAANTATDIAAAIRRGGGES